MENKLTKRILYALCTAAVLAYLVCTLVILAVPAGEMAISPKPFYALLITATVLQILTFMFAGIVNTISELRTEKIRCISLCNLSSVFLFVVLFFTKLIINAAFIINNANINIETLSRNNMNNMYDDIIQYSKNSITQNNALIIISAICIAVFITAFPFFLSRQIKKLKTTE